MFVHDFSPILFSIGPIHIRYYGIAYAIGFILAYFWVKRAIKDGRISGVEEKDIDEGIFIIGIALLIGARLFSFVFDRRLDQLIADPLEFIRVWNGGMSFHGGLIGAITGGLIFTRIRKIKFFEVADFVVLPAIFALGLGRIANFINGELYGYITSVPWCVQFPTAEGCRHPSQLYDSATHFITFGMLYFLWRKKLPTGAVFWAFIAVYGVFRFITALFREDPQFVYISMTLSILMVIVGSFMFWRTVKKAGPST